MISKFKFDLQYFSGGGTSSQRYAKRDPEEPELTALRQGLYGAVMPNLENYDPSRWTTAQNTADNALTQQTNLLGQAGNANNEMLNVLRTGAVPSTLVENMQGSINRGLQSSVGEMLGGLANRGVLNSSITNTGISGLSQKAANAMQDGYTNIFNSVLSGYGGAANNLLNTASGYSGVGDQAFSNAGASLMPAYNMWKDAQTLYNSKEDFDTVVTQKKGLCFITSAVCRVLGKPDDCEELQILRKFRDTYMTRDTGMSRDVAEYYDIAPKICEAIERQEDGGRAEYATVYACGILPALALIQTGDYRWAYLVYKTMVERLKEKYIIGGEG